MHIEPGVVVGAKAMLGYATAATVMGYTAKLAVDVIRKDGINALLLRSLIATVMVFCSFEVFPHYPVGVSEVHLILGTTLFLMFGAVPAAIGLSLGLLIQGLFFAPADLPQYGMNVTSLLVPLLGVNALAHRIIPERTAYKDVEYSHCLALSTAYQGGVVAWVAFWAFYGQGFGASNLLQVGQFGVAYLAVIAVEPIVDLAVLAGVKGLHWLGDSGVFHARLYRAAAE